MNRPEVVRLTGRLLTAMTEEQTRLARLAAREHGVSVAEYVRRRLALRALGGAR